MSCLCSLFFEDYSLSKPTWCQKWLSGRDFRHDGKQHWKRAFATEARSRRNRERSSMLEGALVGGKTRWQSYALITKLADEEKKFQAAVLVQCFDEPTITLADALPYEDEDHKVDVDKILELLEKHFIGEVNEIFESFQFFTRQQREGESTSTFIAEVRRLAASCGFASLHDRMIRDRIVCGIRDNALRRSFLANKNLTLQKCVDQCKAAESSGQLAQSINCRQATVQHHDQSDAEQVPRLLDLNYVRGPPRRTGWSVTSHAAAVRERTTALALPTSKCGSVVAPMARRHARRTGSSAGHAVVGITSQSDAQEIRYILSGQTTLLRIA